MAALGSSFEAWVLQKVRRNGVLVQIALLAALSATLVPPEDAGYTVISLSGQQPIMSANTALIAAATVLNTLVILLFPLSLGVLGPRDARGNADMLIATSPASALSICGGRVLANLLVVLAIAAIAIFFLSTTVAARYGEAPSAMSFAVAGAMVLPPILLSILMGAAIDIFLPQSPAIRSVALFAGFIAIVMCSILGIADFMGVDFLRSLIGTDLENSISIGFIATDPRETFVWQQLSLAGSPIPGERVILSLAITIALVSTTVAGSAFFEAFRRRKMASAFSGGRSNGASLQSRPLEPRELIVTARPAGVSANLPASVLLVAIRTFSASRRAMALLVLAFILALAALPPVFAMSSALFSIALTYSASTHSTVRIATILEMCEPAFARPQALIFSQLCVALPVLASLSPLFLQVELLRVLAIVIAVLLTTSWFSVTHRQHDQQVLGMAVFAGVFYVLAFNDITPSLDILGLGGTSFIAIAIALACTLGLIAWSMRRVSAGTTL